jgi:hypothetical protein
MIKEIYLERVFGTTLGKKKSLNYLNDKLKNHNLNYNTFPSPFPLTLSPGKKNENWVT